MSPPSPLPDDTPPARRQRGVVVAVVLLSVVGALAAMTATDALDYLLEEKGNRQKQTKRTTEEAKEALLAYMLLRTINPMKAASGKSTREPRLLLLPCPDNIGDNDLDGTQDPTCGAISNPRPLEGGSRLGRLPWDTRWDGEVNFGNDPAIYDGLGKDFRDEHGNRFWYALSRNLAPRFPPGLSATPLNFHRLITQEDDWLTIIAHDGRTLSDTAAFVVIAPGKVRGPSYSEEILTTISLSYLNPKKYLDTYTITISGTPELHDNSDKDGKFVDASGGDNPHYNDRLAYVDIQELMSRDYLPTYRGLVGITDIHNRPRPGSPLSAAANALSAHYQVFGAYPLPANSTATVHLSTRTRYCPAYDTGNSSIRAVIPADVTLRAAHDVLLTGAATLTTPATLTLSQPAAFLLADNMTLTLSSDAIVNYNDESLTTALITLTRRARITLTSAVFAVPNPADLLTLSAGQYTLHSAARAANDQPVTIHIPAATPIQPTGNQWGWLGVKNDDVHHRNGLGDGMWTVSVDTEAAFLSGAILTTGSQTVTLSAADTFIITDGGFFQIEDDGDDVIAFNGQIHWADGTTTTIANASPPPETFDRRQFVVRLFADAQQGGATLTAPATIYPWYDEGTARGSPPDSRDNLHDYPSCFDPRHFYDYRFANFLEDQPIFYAVADGCYRGGDGDSCAAGGFTVSLSSGARVALPAALSLSHSFTIPAKMTVVNGELQGTAGVSLDAGERLALPVGATTVILQAVAATVYAPGATIVFPAGTIASGESVHFAGVEAVLIYSPAPLPRVLCALGMTDTTLLTTLTVANQRAPSDNINALCYWLDNEENADEDGEYMIPPPTAPPPMSASNDYFLLFGGVLQI